ncbi:MAG: hypothetical protein K2X38_06825 [Gemmataceae bacterium]|nr:hypothetical protein [Gemmataceae bacterium]
MLLSTRRNRRRRGIVLLIVMAMLALFAGVALSFAFFADGEATLARISRDSERQTAPDADPEMLLSYFLSQLIYDANDTNGVYSALRGHSLVRNLYGYNSAGSNTTPHNGSGRLSYQVTLGTLGNADNKSLINYQYHPSDSFLRDPEHKGTRANPSAALAQFLGEANPAYTYPDLNNVFLGAVNAKGEVLRQSFYRPETGGSLTGNNNVDRYKVLRPHPSYHTQFPAPEDGGGDVKNLDWALGVPNGGGGYFMNDSYWIDAGFPVLTAPDGRKYKPLFAPFVMDLDNRLNLMVAGNYNTAASKSLSNQGFGPFEQNLAPLDGTGKSRIVAATDMATLFRGASKSRYGSDSLPDAATSVTPSAAPYYAMYDFDFDTSASGTPSNWQVPAANSFSMFPTYPAAWLGGVGETTNHPAGYSYWFATGAGNDLRPIAAQNMEALLRFGGKNSPALTSDLWTLLPNTLTPNQPNYNAKARGLLTTLSMSFDRPHISPYIKDNVATTTVYKYDAAAGYPKAQSAYPAPDPTATPADPSSEFGNGTAADYRSIFASRFPRLDLNRKLTDYPLPDVNTGTFALGVMADATQFQTAVSDRQQFAKDIFNRLLAVTGASSNPTAFAPTDPEYLAVRHLAQIAVNVVDYIDNDDYMTSFDWRGDQTEILFGTEMQRLVLNEAYVQYDNDPKENGVKNKVFGTDLNALKYRMCVWIEFHNPLSAPPAGAAYPRDNGKAVLSHVNNEAIYRVHVCKQNANVWADENFRGEPNVADIIKGKDQTGANDVTMTVSAWGANAMVTTDREVLPGAGAFNDAAKANNGFFVSGPEVGAADRFVMNRDPNLPVTFSSPNLVAYFDLPLNPQRPTVVLQRLANEHLPYKDAPGQADHNPYVTIDYLKNVQVSDQLKYDGMADHNPADITTMASSGRRQPSSALNVTAQNSTPGANQPKHTFFRQNSVAATQAAFPAAGETMDAQFEWVTHLDRQLINPLELVHVSTYRPSELTQRIVSNNAGQAGNQKHADAWMDSSSLLYRFLELTTTKDRMVGNQLGGRAPGKININTVWDDEIFQALTDPQSWNNYDVNKSSQIFTALKTARDGNANMITIPSPILPLGVGLNGTSQLNFAAPGGVSTNPLLLTQNASGVNLTHRYQQMELLRKIHNNVTTTSNCFAVWVTVGFFEVTDDNVKPAKLGEEISRRENRHIRHRFFAIVDRSEIVAFQNAPLTLLSGTAPGVCEVSLGAGQHLASQKTVNIGTDVVLEPGMVLEVGTGPNMEVVRIIQVTGANKLTANFAAPPVGKTVTLRGNPGPQTRYDVRRDSQVVPHYTVID